MRDNTYAVKHGRHATPEYQAWRSAINRCEREKDPNFHRYGGRGIIMCPEWRSNFMAFFEHMGERPSKDHSLDRIDTNGNYEPGNCRWATRSEQQRNKRPFTRGESCKKGHAYADVGVYLSVHNGKTRRQCKQCALERARAARI
jgi:hypothetical protein